MYRKLKLIKWLKIVNIDIEVTTAMNCEYRWIQQGLSLIRILLCVTTKLMYQFYSK